MYDQINAYFETILSKFQCGFPKGYSVRNCLKLLFLDKSGFSGIMMTDLSNAAQKTKFSIKDYFIS